MQEITDVVESEGAFCRDISTFVGRLRMHPSDRWSRLSSNDNLACAYETDLSGVRVEIIRTSSPNRRRSDYGRIADEDFSVALFFEDGNFVYVDGVNALIVKPLYDSLENNIARTSGQNVPAYKKDDSSVSA